MSREEETARMIQSLANAVGTLIQCVGVLAENHPDPEVKMEVASMLGAFAITEEDHADKAGSV